MLIHWEYPATAMYAFRAREFSVDLPMCLPCSRNPKGFGEYNFADERRMLRTRDEGVEVHGFLVCCIFVHPVEERFQGTVDMLF